MVKIINLFIWHLPDWMHLLICKVTKYRIGRVGGVWRNTVKDEFRWYHRSAFGDTCTHE